MTDIRKCRHCDTEIDIDDNAHLYDLRRGITHDTVSIVCFECHNVTGFNRRTEVKTDYPERKGVSAARIGGIASYFYLGEAEIIQGGDYG